MNALDINKFVSCDTDPGATLKNFNAYIDELSLLFTLIFRKADGTSYEPTDEEKKALMLLKGGADMKNLCKFVGKIGETDSFAVVTKKIRDGLQERTNKVVQRNMLLSNHPQGTKSFERWFQEVSNAAQLVDYDHYDWKQAAVDAIILQTSNPKLRERALQDNVTYDSLIKLGISKEQSEKGAALLEEASGQAGHSGVRVKVEEDVRRLQSENRDLKSKLYDKAHLKNQCWNCGRDNCERGSKCPANGKKCKKCNKLNHFARVCKKPVRKKKSGKFGHVSSAEDSDSEESLGKIETVGNLQDERIGARISVKGDNEVAGSTELILATDTGVSKTLLNSID